MPAERNHFTETLQNFIENRGIKYRIRDDLAAGKNDLET
jgi:hypothetical protein